MQIWNSVDWGLLFLTTFHMTNEGKCHFLHDWYSFPQYSHDTIVFPTNRSSRGSHDTKTNQISRCKKSEPSWNLWKAPALCEWIDIGLNPLKFDKKTPGSLKIIRFLKERTSRGGFYLSWKWMSLWLIAFESDETLLDLAARGHGWEAESLTVTWVVLLFHSQFES